jgi:hypothetical protein
MKKYLIPLALTILLFILSACAEDDTEAELPTPIPLYTPATPLVLAPLASGRLATASEPTEVSTSTPIATIEGAGVESDEPAATETSTAESDTIATDAPADATTTPETIDSAESDPETTGIVTSTIEVITSEERAEAEDEGETESTGIVTSTLDVIIPDEDNEEATNNPVVEIATVEVAEASSTAEAATPAADAVEGEAVTPEATVETESAPAEAEAASQLPENITAALAQADPAQGEQLVVANGCTACHSLEEGVVQVGPSWYNLAGHAETRVEGQSAEYYIYNSIIHPNDYLVEGFLPNLMPMVYEATLGEQQMAHIIAYLLTLRGEE